jgi:hypothetical protein
MNYTRNITLAVLCVTSWACGSNKHWTDLLTPHKKAPPTAAEAQAPSAMLPQEQPSVIPQNSDTATSSIVSPGPIVFSVISFSKGVHYPYLGDLSFVTTVDLAGGTTEGDCDYSQESDTTGLQVSAGMYTSDLANIFFSYLTNGPTDKVRLFAPGNLCKVQYPYDYQSAAILIKTVGSEAVQIGKFQPLVDQDASSTVRPLLCEGEFAKVCSISLRANIETKFLRQHILTKRMPDNYQATITLTLKDSNQSFVIFNRQ